MWEKDLEEMDVHNSMMYGVYSMLVRFETGNAY